MVIFSKGLGFDRVWARPRHCANPALHLKLSLTKTAEGTIFPLQNLGKKTLKEAQTKSFISVQKLQAKTERGKYILVHVSVTLYRTHRSHAQPSVVNAPGNLNCTFHEHVNSKVQKLPSQLRFSLPSIIITSTSNEPWNRNTQNRLKSTNHKSQTWPLEPVKVKFCFLRDPLRWLTAAKNAIVSWLLNFKICMLVKSAVICHIKNVFEH